MDTEHTLMNISMWQLVLLWIGLYSLVSIVAARSNRVPEYITAQGPLTLIHTSRGRDAIDALAARFPRFWPIWGVAGVALFFVGLAFGTLLILLSAVQVLNQPASATLSKEPQNLLVIPGVNEYLPLEAAPPLVGALIIAMVIHELGHAIYCRLGNIDIKSTGVVLLAIVPAGAFVEPDTDSQEEASRWARIQMVSAGVMNNLGATVVAMMVLVLIVPTVLSPAPGMAISGVLPNSPAEDAGIASGDRIVEIDGNEVETQEDVDRILSNAPNAQFAAVTTADGTDHTLPRRVFVSGVHQSATIEPGDTITHIGDAPIHTKAQLYTELEESDSPRVTLTTEDGGTVEHTVGARVRVEDDSSLSEFASDDGTLVITAVEGERVYDSESASTMLEKVDSGEVITLEGLKSGTSNPEPFETRYAIPDSGLDFVTTSGIGGVVLVDMGVQFFPAEDYLGYITADGISVWASLILIVFLPFATLGGLPYNFAGFTPDIVNFYQVAEPLEPIASLVFFGVSLAFWTVWVNVNLALFNCLPTFALDGGHYARYGLESIAARRGASNPKQASKQYVRVLAALILAGLAMIMVIPPLLG